MQCQLNFDPRQIELIDQNWPDASKRGVIPTELFARIHKQRQHCNALLEKKNDLIAALEEEVLTAQLCFGKNNYFEFDAGNQVRESNGQFRSLVTQYRENASVLASRMESQLQAVAALVTAERGRLDGAHEREREEQAEAARRGWDEALGEVNRASEEQMERRLRMLSDHEAELDRMIAEDNESYIGAKHSLEDDIRVLADQLHFMTSLHQLNEVALPRRLKNT